MAGNIVVLGVLELCAIFSCSWGLYHIQGYSNSILNLTYNGFWFILGTISNLAGILSIIFSYIEDPDDQHKAHFFLQYHYLFAWFTIIVAYPTLVSSFWMVYYPSYYVHAHMALCLIPLAAWFTLQNRYVILATQFNCTLAILSHLYISYLAHNNWGMIGAALIVFNLISLSMPTRYSFAGFSSRETFTVGLASASYIFSLAVEQMAKQPVQLKTIKPW